jgi:hypothetical protein
MLSSKETLHIIAAIVIYQEHGAVKAIKYLQDNGYEFGEAVNLLELADNMRDAVRNGQLS